MRLDDVRCCCSQSVNHINAHILERIKHQLLDKQWTVKQCASRIETETYWDNNVKLQPKSHKPETGHSSGWRSSRVVLGRFSKLLSHDPQSEALAALKWPTVKALSGDPTVLEWLLSSQMWQNAAWQTPTLTIPKSPGYVPDATNSQVNNSFYLSGQLVSVSCSLPQNNSICCWWSSHQCFLVPISAALNAM